MKYKKLQILLFFGSLNIAHCKDISADQFAKAINEKEITKEDINSFLENFGKATKEKNEEQIKKLFDFKTFWKKVVEDNPFIKSLEKQEMLYKFTVERLCKLISDEVQGIIYDRHEIILYDYSKHNPKKIHLITRLWQGSISLKAKWSITLTDNKIKAFDFGLVGMPSGFIKNFGIGLQAAHNKEISKKAATTFQEVIFDAAVATEPEEYESILSKLLALEDESMPAFFQNFMHYFRSYCFAELREFRAGLYFADRIKDSSFSNLSLIRACCLNGLEKFSEALIHCENYKSSVGVDDDYFYFSGKAYIGLDDEAKAFRAFRSGIADDPQSAVLCVMGLIEHLPDENLSEIELHYKSLNNSLQEGAGIFMKFLSKDDADSARRLYYIHNKLYPDDTEVLELMKDFINLDAIMNSLSNKELID